MLERSFAETRVVSRLGSSDRIPVTRSMPSEVELPARISVAATRTETGCRLLALVAPIMATAYPASPRNTTTPHSTAQRTSIKEARTVTVRGPAVALAGGIDALGGVSQNHEANPVRPLSGLTPTVSRGHACRELACCAKANSPGVPVVVVGTQRTPANDPVES